MAREITIDNKKITGVTVDGEGIYEITIHGCPIRFERVGRTGWFSIVGGSGSYKLNLTEANGILAAGIRFRGKDPVSGITSTSWSDWVTIGPVSSSQPMCAFPILPWVPFPPFGCSHGDPVGWAVSMFGTIFDEVGGYCVKPDYIPGWSCAMSPDLYSWGMTTNSAETKGCVYSSTGNSVGAGVRARTYYNRTCISAANNGNFPGAITNIYVENSNFILNPLFTAGKNVIRPTKESSNLIITDEEKDVYLYGLIGLIPGKINTIVAENIRGSQNIDAEIVYVYY